jgi:glycosyltransferase involved in cell wall biosynthesis
MKKPYLSVVIPAYNEEINLKRGVLNSVLEYLEQKKFSWEVLILDDGSKDKTIDLVAEFASHHKNFKLYKEPHRGKGGTLIAGVRYAVGEVVLTLDMDQSTPISEFDKFISKFDEGNDIVIGSRSGRPGQPILRKLMAYGLVVLRTLILRLPHKDTQCGFKAYNQKAVKKVFDKIQIYGGSKTANSSGSVSAGFDMEVLYIARKQKLKVAEVSVEWYEYGERREVSPIRDSWEGLRDLIQIRLNAIQGKYRS